MKILEYSSNQLIFKRIQYRLKNSKKKQITISLQVRLKAQGGKNEQFKGYRFHYGIPKVS